MLGSRSPVDTFDKITVREFELTDAKGTKRAPIKKVESTGWCSGLLRKRDPGKTWARVNRVLVLCCWIDNTDPGVHAHANKDGSGLTITGKDKKKREY